MDEELRIQLEEAKANGADEAQLRQMIRDYLAEKKKSEVLPLDSPLETDTTDVSSSVAPASQQDVGSSDSQAVESTSEDTRPVMGEDLRSYLTDLRAYGANEEELRDAIRDWESQPEPEMEYRIGDRVISEAEAMKLQTVQDSYVRRLREFAVENFSLEIYNRSRPDRPINLTNMSESEKERLRLETIDKIIADYDQHEAESELAAGVYQERAGVLGKLRNEVQGYGANQRRGLVVKKYRDKYDVQTVDEYIARFSRENAEWTKLGMGAGQNRVAETGYTPYGVKVIATAQSNPDEDYWEAEDENRRQFRNSIYERVSADLNETLTEEERTPEALAELEKRMHKEYGLTLDLNGNKMYDARRSLTGSVWLDNNIGGFSASLASIVRAGSEAFGAIEYEANSEGRRTLIQQWQDSSEELMSTPITGAWDKLTKEGDISGSLYDVTSMFGSSVPLMSVAIGTSMVTRKPVWIGSATTLAGSAMAYGDAADEKWYQELTTAEKGGYLMAMGVFEAAPALVGAHIISRTSSLLKGAAASTQGSVGMEMAKAFVKSTALGVVEEAVTEGATAGGQYFTTMFAQGKEPTYEGFKSAVMEGAYAGGILGGTIAGGVNLASSLALGADAMFADRIEIRKLIDEAAQQENAFGRSEVGKRLLKAVSRARKGLKDREAFYSAIEEENNGDYRSLLEIQAGLAKLALLHRRTTGDARAQVRSQMDALLKERAKIEKKYDEQFDVDIKAERKRMLQAVSRIDKNFSKYLQFAKGTDTTIRIDEQENPDEVLARLEEAALGDLRNNPNVDPSTVVTKFLTTDSQQQSLRNAFTVAKALRGVVNMVTGKTADVFVHANIEAFAQATGRALEDIARGVYMSDGNIHLLLPALKENTAFHEGFHHFLVEDLGSKEGSVSGAVTGMAEVLAKSIKDTDLYVSMMQFLQDSNIDLSEYAGRRGKIDLERLFKSDAKAADEFLVELLARITNGEVSIQFRKSMLRAFTEYVSNYLNKAGLNVGNLPTAKGQDLVDAITMLTQRFAEGKDLTEARGALQEAADRMFDSEQQTEYDRTDKTQAVAGNRLFNEPLAEVSEIADRYFERAFGRRRPRFFGTRYLDPEYSKRISDAFIAMDDNVKFGITRARAEEVGDTRSLEIYEAYEAMINETLAQYEAMLEAGYRVEINNEEPYGNSAEMIEDLRENKRIKIFSTEAGFGGPTDTLFGIPKRARELNPLLAPTEFTDVNGQTLLANDVFRAVHDFFGHAELGNSFGPKGEENAWMVHSRMYSPLARKAMTSETRGQNSYVNFSGVNEEIEVLRVEARKLRDEGQLQKAEALVARIYDYTRFADQKIGLLPDEFIEIREDYIGDIDIVAQLPREVVYGPQDNSESGIDQQLKDKAQPLEMFRKTDLERLLAKGMMIHGTAVEITEFDEQYINRFVYGYGFYFTDNINQAADYANRTRETPQVTFIDTYGLRLADESVMLEDVDVKLLAKKLPDILTGRVKNKLMEGVVDKGVETIRYSEEEADAIVNAMISTWNSNLDYVFDAELDEDGDLEFDVDEVIEIQEYQTSILNEIADAFAAENNLGELFGLSASTRFDLDGSPLYAKLWAMAFSQSLVEVMGIDGINLRVGDTKNTVVFNFDKLSDAIRERPEIELGPDARAYYEAKREELEAQQQEEQDSQGLIDLDNLFSKDQPVERAANQIQNAREFASRSNIRNGVEFKQALQVRFKETSDELKREYRLRSFDGTQDNNEPLKKYLVDAYVNETLIALQEFPEAIGWYDSKTRAAMEIMSEVHPELKTDAESIMAFKLALAITSNGNKVNQNFEAADSVYREWKETGKFREQDNLGTQAKGINKAFTLLNNILAQGVSMSQLETFLTTKFRAGDLPKKLVTGELVDNEVFGAAIFGSKIGQGFLMNLMGNFDQLTMDRWFMRQYGRLTGTLLQRDAKKVARAQARVKESLAAIKGDRETQAILRRVIGPYSKLGIKAVAEAVQKASVRKDLRDQLSSVEVLDELRKASNMYVLANRGEVETPAGSKHRNFLRDVFSRVQQELKETHGIDITIADLQAVNWYPEKALYQSFKENQTSQDGKESITNEEQPDYQSAAARLARNQGVDESTITDAIGRIDGEFGQLREDVGRRAAEGSQRTGTSDSGSVDQTLQALNQAIGGKAQAVNSAKNFDGIGKAQGDLIAIISEFIDKSMPGPVLKRDRRKKKPFSFVYSDSQLEAIQRTKKEVMAVLQANGMSKADADALFKQALAFKRGRNAGKRMATKNVKKILGEKLRLKTTEARRLKKDLEKLKTKSTTVDEFFKEALDLINERMKGRKSDPFTRGQVKRLFAVARGATKVSAARLAKIKKDGGNPQDAMQVFIDRMAAIFDEQDAKAAMKEYLDQVVLARKLQAKLRKKAKQPARGKAAKNISSYQRSIQMLTGIDSRLLPVQVIQEFNAALMAADSSTSKVKTEKTDTGRQAQVPERFEATRLEALASQFKVMEELGRIELFRAKAERLAKKNNTSAEEEFKKLMQGYAFSKMSSSKRAILSRIAKHNAANPNEQLDPGNPEDLEKIINEMVEERSKDEQDISRAIVDDAILPLVAANVDKMLEDPDVARIMGQLTGDSDSVLDLRDRLLRLDKATLVALEYRLSDYIINDSVYGMGYMAAKVKGQLDMADQIKGLNLKGRNARLLNFFSFMDTMDSYLRFLFPVDNVTNAKLRRALGISAIERSFAIADRVHADDVKTLEEFVAELDGDVTSISAKAIAQIFSMSRQVPTNQDGMPEMDEAQWFLALRDAMKRTIEHNEKQKDLYSEEDIEQMKFAYDLLFEGNSNLMELQASVQASNPDVVSLVDFMVATHKRKLDTFANYVARFLGKELVLEDNYTPFKVTSVSQNENYEFIVELRNSMRDKLQEMSLSNTKRVAGASFERNKRSIIGTKNLIGLDFIAINERALRENTILSYTVGDMLSARFALDSEAMSDAVPNVTLRHRLRDMIAQYATQDRSNTPLFQESYSALGKQVINPLPILRDMMVVRAFGGIITQTLKQSTVLLSVSFSAKNTIQATGYLTSLMGELISYNVENLARKDSKLALANDGRYDLLAESPVFSRDFEAGQIDPFTGRIDLDPSRLKRFRRRAMDISLANLKGTDKVAAIASWFTFYGDYLISTGQVNSYSEIDWAAEASNPNRDALSYADSLVSKDQAASTPRQAAGIYKDKNALADLFTQVYLPFARFALNKKRSVGSDFVRLLQQDAEARKDGARSMVGHIAELTAFSAISRYFLPMLARLVIGEDEEERLRKKAERFYNTLGQVILDLSPLPPLEFIDNDVKYMLNKYILFPMTTGFEFQDFEENYERWINSDAGVVIYDRAAREGQRSMTFLLGPLTANVDEFIRSVTEMYDATKVTGRTGKEYYIRPEDREAMQMHLMLKAVLSGASFFGIGIKELDMIASQLDDLPRERSLDNEEELLAYETLIQNLIPESEIAQMLAGQKPTERLVEKIQEATGESPMEAEAIARRFERGINDLTAEFVLKQTYPDIFSKYIREIRGLEQAVRGAKDYYLYMQRRKETMAPQDYEELKEMADVYAAQLHPSWLEADAYYNLTEE